MTVEALPVEATDRALNDRFRRRLDMINKFGKVAVQNYYDGRINLMSESSASVSTKYLEAGYGRQRSVAPPVWRIVRGEEAKNLWKLQVYKDYYEMVGSWGQDKFYKAMKELKGKHVPPEEELAIMPPDIRDEYKLLEEWMRVKAEGLQDMKDYSSRDVRRDKKTQVWYVGRLLSGRAKMIADHMRYIAIAARKERDAEFIARKNSDLFQKEAMAIKARMKAYEELGLTPESFEQVTPNAPRPAKKTKKAKRKSGRKKKAVKDE